MIRNRRTRIVATLGPASCAPEMILTLARAGVDVFRLNFSHGSHDGHAEAFANVRAAEKAIDRPLGILADLQGPKLRLGLFADGGVSVVPGQAFRLDMDPKPGDATRVSMPHPEIFAAMKPGADLLIDDGKVRLAIKACGRDYCEAEVVSGARLSDRKGVTLKGALLAMPALTEKDRKDLAFALRLGVDWIALSFVQRPEDVAELRRLVEGRAAVLAKIEKRSALEQLEPILDLCDGLMVARGDLGVEMDPEDVPVAQKAILRAARRRGIPVIVATQMLESMISAPAPTRAEASDVATAVYEGADAVMLSAETASGAYPVEAVEIMNRIAARIERDPFYRRTMNAEAPVPEANTSDAITAAANQVARTIGAAAITTFTSSGSTTLRASRERPAMPILCLTAIPATARRLMLSYGVRSIVTPDIHSFGQMVEVAARMARSTGIARVGDRLVVTAGVPFGTPGNTNTLRISVVD